MANKTKKAKKMGFNIAGGNSKYGFRTVPNESVQWRLEANGKYFGDVSYNAYKAIESGTLDSYVPKNDNEKSIIEEFKNWTGYGKTPESVVSQYEKDKFGKGNIDLTDRPVYQHDDGQISTVSSMSFNENGKEILVPTIVKDASGKAKQLTEEEAIAHYHKTGEYLGKFNTVDEADEYAQRLHVDQELYYTFKANSQYKSTKNNKEKHRILGSNYYDETGYDDIMHDYINGNEDAIAIVNVNEATSKQLLLGTDSQFLKTMTPKEVSIYNYIYNVHGKDAGKEFIKDISKDLNLRQRVQSQEGLAEYAKKHKWSTSIATILLAPAKTISAVGQINDYMDDGEIDQNAGYNKYVYNPQAARKSVSEEIEKGVTGKVGSFLYQTGMSIGDSTVNTLASGGNKLLSLGTMGIGAFADRVVSAKDNGLSDEQAIGLGIIAGGAEIAFEALSFDKLTSFLKNSSKTTAKKATAQGVKHYLLDNIKTNALEELGTEGVNFIADLIVSGDKSEWSTKVKQYTDEGYSEGKAFGLALRDKAIDFALTGLAGGLSGGVMSSSGAIFLNSTYKSIGKESANKKADIIAQGISYDKDTEAHQNAVKLYMKKDVSDAELGKQVLLNEIQNRESSRKSASVGDMYIDKVTNNIIKVVDRDEQYTTVEIDNGKKITTKKFKNTQADTFSVNEQLLKVESKTATPSETSSAKVTSTDVANVESVSGEVVNTATPADTIAIGSTYKDSKTGKTIKIVNRDTANTVVDIVDTNGNVTTGTYSTDRFDRAITKGQLVKTTDTEDVAKNETTTTPAAETIPTDSETKTISLRRVGDSYELYGNDALALADELKMETTLKVVNGVETDVLVIPENFADGFAQAMADEGYTINFSDKPSVSANATTEVENGVVADEIATTDETTPSEKETLTESEMDVVTNAIEESLTAQAKADLNNGEVKENYVRIAKTLINVYESKGTITEDFGFFFTDGGKAVDEAIGNALSKVTTDTEATETTASVSEKEMVETEVSEPKVLKNEQESDTIDSTKELNSVEREDNGNESIREDLLHGNGKRRGNESTRKQTERLLSFRRKNQGKDGTERRDFARELIEREQVEEGTEGECNYTLVNKDAYNDDMLSLYEYGKSKGIEIGICVGDMTLDVELDDGTIVTKSLRGMKVSPTRILVRYDADRPPQLIFKHEYAHAKYKTPAMQKIKNFILGSLSEETKQEILLQERYADYAETYKNNMDIVWEEFVCDVMSGYSEYFERFADTVNDYWYGNETVDNYKVSEYTESIDAGGKGTNVPSSDGRYDVDEGDEYDGKINNSRRISEISENSRNSERRNTSDKRMSSASATERESENGDSARSTEGRGNQRSSETRMGENLHGGKSAFRTEGKETKGRRFLEAIKSGDVDTARTLLDEKATEGGYIASKVYHGTKAETAFVRFKGEKPIWITPDIDYASAYGGEITDDTSYLYTEPNSKVYELYAKYGNTLELGDIEKEILNYDDVVNFAKKIGFTINEVFACRSQGRVYETDAIWSITHTPKFADLARKKGYDSLHALEDGGKVETYGILYPENVKSAKLETYDDKGNLIPLSDRFDNTTDDIRYDLDDDYSKIYEMNLEIQQLTNQIRELEKSDEFGRVMDELSKAVADDNVEKGTEIYNNWLNDSGYNKLREKRDKLQEEVNERNKTWKESHEKKELEAEKKAIEKSGLSEADYFRKQAVKEFGYTPYFYDAGYITPNGKMLNFSGEKGQHFGSRGQDHRAIGIVYANVDGSKAMVKFMGEGNIRIMAESPGIDISSLVEPTKEQYATIRKFVREYADREFFNIDITNAEGQTIGNYEYEGRLSAERVVNDIKYFFENGTTREASSIAQFRYDLDDTDSEGKTLTEAQQEYFKDSKERDENGNLRVMYRGDAENITVFDRKKSKYSNLYGRGFYFTNSEEHAKQYGDLKSYYLDIKHPVSTTETTITKSQLKKFLQVVSENEDYGLDNYGYGATVDSVLQSTYGKSDFLMLYDINQTAIGDLVEAIELFNEVNGTDFDGIILDTETVIFNSEQAKLTSNENPTTDPDIRYDLSDEDAEYMKAVESGDLETQERIIYEAAQKAGYPEGVYHGTGGFGFTKADVSKSDDNISLFATDSKEVAGTYSGTRGTRRIVDAPNKLSENEVEAIHKQARLEINEFAEFCNSTLGEKDFVTYGYMLDSLNEAFNSLEIGVPSEDAKDTFVAFCDDLFYTFIGNYYHYNYNYKEFSYEAFEDSKEYKKLADKYYDYVNKITSKFAFLDTSDAKGIYDLYAKTDGFLEVDAKEKKWNEIPNDGVPFGDITDELLTWSELKWFEENGRKWTTRTLAKMARKLGYSGVKITNVFDDGGKGLYRQEEPATVYIFFKPEKQTKSADLVTYDDDGNIIPPSQRFNGDNDDWRWDIDGGKSELDTQKKIESIAQTVTHDELIELAKQNTQEFVDKVKENKSLQKRLSNAKRQMLANPNPVVNVAQVGRVTKEILSEMDSTLKAKDLQEDVISIYNEHAQTIKKAGGVESKVQEANDTMVKRFATLAVDIADNAEVFVESEMYGLLKSYVKETRIKIPDDAKQEADYAQFRKSHMGTFNLTNDGLDIDIAYQELCDMFPGMFDAGISHPTDQLYAIADTLENLKPYAYNPHSGYMQDAIDHIVYKFVTEADGIAATPKTKAQKMAERAKADKELALYKEKENFERKLDKHKATSKKNIQALQKKLDDFKYVQYWEKRLSKEEKAQAIKDAKAHTAEVKMRAKEEKARAIKAIRDRQKIAVLKSKIRNIVSDMKKKLDKTEKTGGYPKELVKTVAEVCSAIDFHTDRTSEDGSPTKASLKLDALKIEYDALKNNENYDFASEYRQELSDKIGELYQTVKGKRVVDLNLAELSELKDILGEISHSLSTATKQIGNAEAKANADLAWDIIESLNEKSDLNDMNKRLFLRENKIGIQSLKAFVLNPHRINEMIAGYDQNSVWWKLHDAINRGNRKAAKFVMEANKPFDDLTDGGGNEIAFYDFRTKKIKTGIKYIDGSEVEIPKSIICEMVMMWNRKDGQTHLATGGATIPDIELYNKGKTTDAIKGGKRTKPITVHDITRLKGLLDSYDMAWIDRAHNLFNKVSKDAINSTSMELVGRELARTDNYIRMYVNQDFVGKEVGRDQDNITLEGHGSLKETKPKAKQSLLFRGLHENVFDNIEFVSKYYGLAIPIRNFNKVYRMSFRDGNDQSSVKEVIGKKFGAKIQAGVVEQYIKELQTARKREHAVFDEIRGNWLGATFWGNINSALKQTSSYWTGSALLGEDSLVKGLKNFAKNAKQTKAEIEKYSGTLYKRGQGLSTTELGDRANRKRLAGASNKITKLINEKAPALRKIPQGLRPGNWLQAMDVNTSAALWEACKVEVAKTMEVSDENYMQTVADLWERVIEETQSNYDVMHRPESLKSTNPITQTVTMFTTDIQQKFGLLFSAYKDFSTKSELYKKGGSAADEIAKKEAGKRLSKASRSIVYSALWMGFVSVLANMVLRKFKSYIDDEEKDITAKSVAKQYATFVGEDLFNTIMPVGSSLILQAMDTFNNGYDFASVPSFDVIEDFIVSLSKIYNAATDEDGDVLGVLADSTYSISNMTGIPVKNISDIIKAIKGYAGDIKELDFAHDIEDYASGNKSFYSYGDLASHIITGDTEKQKKILDYYSANGKEIAKGSLTEQLKPAYVQLYIDSPQSAYKVKRQLILEYDYSEKAIDEWTIKVYLDNIVSDPEYAAEIKGAVQTNSTWNSSSVYKLAKSNYKQVYKDGDEKDIEDLKNALIDSKVVVKGDISKWESEAKAEMEKSKLKSDAEKEKYR